MERVKKIRYRKIHRKIKYPRLEFKTGRLMLILPEGYAGGKKLVEKHADWISKKQQFIEKGLKTAGRLNLNEGTDLDDLKTAVKKTTGKFAAELGVETNSIYFRHMKTRWASCGNNGNLTFNTRLRFLPKRLLRYVIFHEVAHRVERRHNGKFYDIMGRKYPDAEKMEEKLFAYWFLIQQNTLREKGEFK